MSVLILVKPGHSGELTRGFVDICEILSGKDFQVVTNEVVEPPSERFTINVVNEAEYIRTIRDLKFDQVVLVGYSRFEKIPKEFLLSVMVKDIDAIRVFINGVLARYHPFKGKCSETILVFPGPVLPLNMGSHQRAFNMLCALAYSGCYVDVIITGNKLSRSARLLQTVCPNVYTYKNNKRKMPKYLRFRRYLEKIWREKQGVRGSVPETFCDRLSNKATFSLQKTLSRLVVENKTYKNLIVSYAWMAKCTQIIPKERLADLKLICDTHDVQYIRNKSADKYQLRFMPFSSFDKWVEKETLRKFDKILAISDSDCSELSKEFGGDVLKAGSAFEYMAPVQADFKSGFNFGFIGGGMQANVIALEYILDKWWPLVRNYSPSSKLYIAGTVGKADEIIERTAFDESVVTLGFVDDVLDFYKRIHISLNPVLVQGGLNFKSVEAVMAGKLLITNELGAECLGASNIATVCSGGNALINELQIIEADGASLSQLLVERRERALSCFGDAGAYDDLRGYLSE